MKINFINSIFKAPFYQKNDEIIVSKKEYNNSNSNHSGNQTIPSYYGYYNYIPNFAFTGRRRKNAVQKEPAIIPESKAKEFLDAFPARNKSIEHVIKAFEVNPALQNTDIASLKANISRIIEHFNENGKLSHWAYNRACYNRPELFTFPADEVIANVENVYEQFKKDGMKLDEYIDVCTYYPKLFVTPFTEIINRINNLHSINEKKYTKKECIAMCMDNPELIFSNFDNINSTAKARDFIKRANKANSAAFKIPNAVNYVDSPELIYLIFASPAEFAGCTSKQEIDEQLDKFIFYHRTHSSSNLALKVPDIEGVDEYKRVLREFLNPKICRDAFEVTKKVKSNDDEYLPYSDAAFWKTLSDTDNFLASLSKATEKLSSVNDEPDADNTELSSNDNDNDTKETVDDDEVQENTTGCDIKTSNDTAAENIESADETAPDNTDNTTNSQKITNEAIKLRNQGMTYTNIAKQFNISQTAAMNRVKIHTAKSMLSKNNLSEQYYTRAKLLHDTFHFQHSIDDIIKIIVDNPTILNADINKFKKNVYGVVYELAPYGLTDKDYIEACFREPLLLHQVSSSVAKRITDLCDRFEADGLTKEKYIKACLTCPELFTRSADSIANNINGVVNSFANAGLDRKGYIKSCLYSPSLLNAKSETIVANLYEIINRFKDNGLTIEDLIKACLNNYRVFVQNPKTIISNVETVYEYYKDKGLTLEEYIHKCVVQSSLLAGNPKTIINKINAYLYTTGAKEISTAYASYSLEYIYMLKIVLQQFIDKHEGVINNQGKRPYNAEVKQQIIDYYKNHKNETLTLKIPIGECATECIEVLNKFSTENIGRNIFKYEFTK